MVEKGLLGGVVEICRINIVLRAWVVDWLFLKGGGDTVPFAQDS